MLWGVCVKIPGPVALKAILGETSILRMMHPKAIQGHLLGRNERPLHATLFRVKAEE